MLTTFGAGKPTFKRKYKDVRYSRGNAFINAGHYNNGASNELQSRYIAMFTADGSMSPEGYVTFCFSKNRKVERCKHILDRLGVEYSLNEQHRKSGVINYVFYVGKRNNHLLDGFVGRDKKLTINCVHHLDIKAFLNEVQYWDATYTSASNQQSVRFTSTVKETIEIIQMMSILQGKKSTIRYDLYNYNSTNGKHSVSYYLNYKRNRDDAHTFMSGDTPDWNNPIIQDVYCVNMPLGTLVIRHKGKVSIQGNCDYSQLELRVASWLSGDINMQHAYQSGSDLHSKTTELLFGDTSGLSPEEAKRKRTQSKSCFSGDTEILTENGFVEFRMYDGVTPVAQYNKETKTISYEEPIAFKSFKNQPVYNFSNENTSIICTGNHNILLTHLSQKFVGKPINTIIEMDKVHTLPKSRKSMTIHAGWYKNNHNYIDDRLTRVIASVVSDGHITENYRSVEFSFKKKRKFIRFMRIMNNYGVAFEQGFRESAKDYYNFSIKRSNKANEELFNVLKEVVGRDKTLTRKSLELLNPIAYLDEAQYWDGSVDAHGLCRFTCSNYTTISLMQEMAVLNGVRARLSEFSIENTNNKNPLYCLSYNLSKDEYAKVSTADFPSEPTGNEDVYCVQMRDGVIVTRHKGKVTILPQCNFGFLYGMVAKTFIQYALGFGLTLTQEESEKIRADFFKAYPRLLVWHEECKEFARQHGYIESPIGRKRWFDNINSRDFRKRSADERKAINSPVQGFGSDLCTSSLADIVFSKELDHTRFNVLGSVHDAILFEIRDDYVEELVPKLKYMMEHPSIIEDMEVPIPLVADVEVSQSWGGH